MFHSKQLGEKKYLEKPLANTCNLLLIADANIN